MKYVVAFTLIALALSGCGSQTRISTQKSASQDNKLELDEQAKQLPLDTCRPFTELEKQILTSPKVSNQDKSRAIDTFLVTLRGVQCKEVVDNLFIIFKDSPLVDLITQRKMQMQKITAKDLLDINSQNSALVFDGADVWSTASDSITVKLIEGTDDVQIKGDIKADGKTLGVSTILPRNVFRNLQAITQKEVVEVVRQQAMRFENGEFKYTNTTTSSKATQVLNDIKKRMTSDDVVRDVGTSAIPSLPSVAKFTFDLSDKERLNYCGAQSIADKMIEQVKKSPIYNIEELLITDLGIAKTEPEAPQKKFKILNSSNDEAAQQAELDQKMYEYSLSPTLEQNVEKQGFWVISQSGKSGKLFTLETLIKPTDFTKSKMLNFSFFERQFDFTNTNQVERTNEKGALSYNVKSLPNLESKLRVKFDPASAYWFKIRTESVAKCMEQNKFAAVGASRDSLKTFIVFSIFDKIYGQKLSQSP